MSFDKSDLIFLPVGGSEEIGMNANLYHFNDKMDTYRFRNFFSR